MSENRSNSLRIDVGAGATEKPALLASLPWISPPMAPEPLAAEAHPEVLAAAPEPVVAVIAPPEPPPPAATAEAPQPAAEPPVERRTYYRVDAGDGVSPHGGETVDHDRETYQPSHEWPEERSSIAGLIVLLMLLTATGMVYLMLTGLNRPFGGQPIDSSGRANPHGAAVAIDEASTQTEHQNTPAETELPPVPQPSDSAADDSETPTAEGPASAEDLVSVEQQQAEAAPAEPAEEPQLVAQSPAEKPETQPQPPQETVGAEEQDMTGDRYAEPPGGFVRTAYNPINNREIDFSGFRPRVPVNQAPRAPVDRAVRQKVLPPIFAP